MIINRNDLLFNDQLTPITRSFGLFSKPIHTVVRKFLKWRKKLMRDNDYYKKITHQKMQTNLLGSLNSLLPILYGEESKYLFVPIENNWTAYFTNGIRGTDPSAISYLPRLIKCQGIWIVASSINKCSSEALIMEVYGHRNTEWLNLIRKIRLEKDAGKWRWESWGNCFPFEDVTRYELRRKTDRFDIQLMVKYLNTMGCPSPFLKSSYLNGMGNEAVLVDIELAYTENYREVDLAEAKRLNYYE